MPPDILAQNRGCSRPPKPRRMDRMRRSVQPLLPRHSRQRRRNRRVRNPQRGRNPRYVTDRLGNAFKPAHPAPRRPDIAPPPRHERLGRPVSQPHSCRNPSRNRSDFHLRNLAFRYDDPFSQTEPDSEILKVRRTRHHHRMRRAVIAECHRRLLREFPPVGRDHPGAPNRPRHTHRCGRNVGHSAAAAGAICRAAALCA